MTTIEEANEKTKKLKKIRTKVMRMANKEMAKNANVPLGKRPAAPQKVGHYAMSRIDDLLHVSDDDPSQHEHRGRKFWLKRAAIAGKRQRKWAERLKEDKNSEVSSGTGSAVPKGYTVAYLRPAKKGAFGSKPARWGEHGTYSDEADAHRAAAELRKDGHKVRVMKEEVLDIDLKENILRKAYSAAKLAYRGHKLGREAGADNKQAGDLENIDRNLTLGRKLSLGDSFKALGVLTKLRSLPSAAAELRQNAKIHQGQSETSSLSYGAKKAKALGLPLKESQVTDILLKRAKAAEANQPKQGGGATLQQVMRARMVAADKAAGHSSKSNALKPYIDKAKGVAQGAKDRVNAKIAEIKRGLDVMPDAKEMDLRTFSPPLPERPKIPSKLEKRKAELEKKKLNEAMVKKPSASALKNALTARIADEFYGAKHSGAPVISEGGMKELATIEQEKKRLAARAKAEQDKESKGAAPGYYQSPKKRGRQYFPKPPLAKMDEEDLTPAKKMEYAKKYLEGRRYAQKTTHRDHGVGSTSKGSDHRDYGVGSTKKGKNHRDYRTDKLEEGHNREAIERMKNATPTGRYLGGKRFTKERYQKGKEERKALENKIQGYRDAEKARNKERYLKGKASRDENLEEGIAKNIWHRINLDRDNLKLTGTSLALGATTKSLKHTIDAMAKTKKGDVEGARKERALAKAYEIASNSITRKRKLLKKTSAPELKNYMRLKEGSVISFTPGNKKKVTKGPGEIKQFPKKETPESFDDKVKRFGAALEGPGTEGKDLKESSLIRKGAAAYKLYKQKRAMQDDAERKLDAADRLDSVQSKLDRKQKLGFFDSVIALGTVMRDRRGAAKNMRADAKMKERIARGRNLTGGRMKGNWLYKEEALEEKYLGFDKLAKKVGSPALAAYIGRKKYGKKKFDNAAHKGVKLKKKR